MPSWSLTGPCLGSIPGDNFVISWPASLKRPDIRSLLWLIALTFPASSVSSSPAFPPSCCGSWPRCSQPGRVHKLVEGNGPLLSVGQCLGHVWLFATQWTAAHQATLSFTISLSLLKLMSIESVMPSNHLILCHPLLLLPWTSPALKFIRVFSNELILRIRWPKYWSFSFSISPSNEYSGLISLRIDSPCSPRDSQESLPAWYFKSINSLVISLPYNPTLTSVHDYWKNHNFDYMDLCQQNDVSAF